jgi:hypothetical protein
MISEGKPNNPPMVKLKKRNMSATPTSTRTAPKSPGLYVKHIRHVGVTISTCTPAVRWMIKELL